MPDACVQMNAIPLGTVTDQNSCRQSHVTQLHSRTQFCLSLSTPEGESSPSVRLFAETKFESQPAYGHFEPVASAAVWARLADRLMCCANRRYSCCDHARVYRHPGQSAMSSGLWPCDRRSWLRAIAGNPRSWVLFWACRGLGSLARHPQSVSLTGGPASNVATFAVRLAYLRQALSRASLIPRMRMSVALPCAALKPATMNGFLPIFVVPNSR
jgi:hypothetical protein